LTNQGYPGEAKTPLQPGPVRITAEADRSLWEHELSSFDLAISERGNGRHPATARGFLSSEFQAATGWQPVMAVQRRVDARGRMVTCDQDNRLGVNRAVISMTRR
jgi:hypothetical protein